MPTFFATQHRWRVRVVAPSGPQVLDLVLGWNPVLGGVVEGCSDYEDGPGGDEAADDLALGACEGDREAVGDREGRGA